MQSPFTNPLLKKKTVTPKLPNKYEDSEDDPFEHLSAMLKPTSSMDKERNHIYFYSPVNQESCLQLNRKINDLNKELLQHAIEYETEPPNIYLHINSHGGCLFSAFSTIDTIMNSKIPIVSIIEGCAASAATIISMVCHKRYCTSNSFMLIHQLSSGASGKYEEMKDDFMNDTKLMELLYKLYLEHTTMDIKTIKKVLKRDIWWDVNESIKHGLIDDEWTGTKIMFEIKKDFGNDSFSTEKITKSTNKSLKRPIVEQAEDSESDSDSESKVKQTKSKDKRKRTK